MDWIYRRIPEHWKGPGPPAKISLMFNFIFILQFFSRCAMAPANCHIQQLSRRVCLPHFVTKSGPFLSILIRWSQHTAFFPLWHVSPSTTASNFKIFIDLMSFCVNLNVKHKSHRNKLDWEKKASIFLISIQNWQMERWRSARGIFWPFICKKISILGVKPKGNQTFPLVSNSKAIIENKVKE